MNIFAVVGVWAGCAQDVKLCSSEEEAEEEKKKLLEEYDIQGIDLENSDHDIKVFEVLPQMMAETLKQALKDVHLARLECKKCKLFFLITGDYSGVTSCPYCGEYIEG